jgi:hypothetical protein
MIRAASIACATLALCATPAAAAEGKATAAATIVESTGVQVNWPMAMPSVQGVRSGASFIGAMPSMGMAMMLMPRGAAPLVQRQDATGTPVTAPGSFEVMQKPGEDALTVKTGPNSELRIGSTGVIAGGALVGGSAASIAVGRGVALSVTDRGGAPVSTDTLEIVVQYN